MNKNLKKRSVPLWPTKDLISANESGDLDLGTEYQRDVIWPKSKQMLLIDSMLKDIDIPKIYLAYFTKEKKYECIDGKQRIASILGFYNNNLPEISGEYYNKLQDKSTFLDYEFSVSIIADPTDEEISELFFRLNIGTPLNGGERINAMRGDMRNFIFETIGEKGAFIGKVGMKEYRFSREIAIAQMILNSLFFRKKDEFVRARYEDIYKFLLQKENVHFDSSIKGKVNKFRSTLAEVENVFDKSAFKLKRKSAIVSAYLFCEEIIEKKSGKGLKEFPAFYLRLLDEIKQQADLIKKYQIPKKKRLLDEFQIYLQQASAEGYSVKRRHKFLRDAFAYYLKNQTILGDN